MASLFFPSIASKELTQLLPNSYRIGRNFHGISAGRAMKLYVSSEPSFKPERPYIWIAQGLTRKL